MNKYGLQNFIEQNAGKQFGDEYRYGDFFMYTRYCRATEPHFVEVSFNLPWITISDCFDEFDIPNNLEFYGWLKDKFIPLVEKRISKGE